MTYPPDYHSNWKLLILLGLFVAIGLWYDVTVPLFEKPDELKHFALIQYLQTQHELPTVQAGVYRPYDQEGTQPPLYHGLVALAVSWLDLTDFTEPPRNPHYADDRSFAWRERSNNNLYLHPPNELWSTDPIHLAARIGRWMSLLCGLLTIGLTYQLARLTFEGEKHEKNAALLTAALVAFIPQFMHVSTAITNDSLSTTLAAAALLLMGRILKHGSHVRYTSLLGIVIGLAALTKLSLLYLTLLLPFVLAMGATRTDSHGVSPAGRRPTIAALARTVNVGQLIAHSLLIALLTVAISGGWFWRNWQLYGDWTALNAHLLYRGGPLDPTPTFAQLWQTELVGLELSFWAAFGAGQILLEPWIYDALRMVKYIVAVGLIIGIGRIIHGRFSQTGVTQTEPVQTDFDRPTRYAILSLLALWVIIIFIALLRWMQITPASWGRLLYPTLPALAILTRWSLSQFYLSRWSHTVYLGPTLLLVSLISLAIISPFHTIQAAYGKTPLMTASALASRTFEPLDWRYDNGLHLLGYHLEKTEIQPGQRLPVTLYWQTTRPLTTNYSVFVHLLTESPTGEVIKIGQVNRYPDGGNWPTSYLPLQTVLADRYHVPISSTAPAPTMVRLALGIFDFADPVRTAKPAYHANGDLVDPIVGTVSLRPNVWPRSTPHQTVEVDFGQQIKLLGYDVKQLPQREGLHRLTSSAAVITLTQPIAAPLGLTLYWQALDSPRQDLTLFMHLLDSATQAQRAGFDAPPRYPTHFWQVGDTIIDPRHLTLPPDLAPGRYTLSIGWYHPETYQRLPLATSPQDAWPLLTLSIIKP